MLVFGFFLFVILNRILRFSIVVLLVLDKYRGYLVVDDMGGRKWVWKCIILGLKFKFLVY